MSNPLGEVSPGLGHTGHHGRVWPSAQWGERTALSPGDMAERESVACVDREIQEIDTCCHSGPTPAAVPDHSAQPRPPVPGRPTQGCPEGGGVGWTPPSHLSFAVHCKISPCFINYSCCSLRQTAVQTVYCHGLESPSFIKLASGRGMEH